MGKDGYFSPGITNLSYNASLSQFLTGGSAMMYMGTWLLAQINSSENTQGKNIGFMPFPGVSGGKGSIKQYPANTGSPERHKRQAVRSQSAGVVEVHRSELWECISERPG